MLIKKRRGWEIPESMATPEGVFLNRRRFLRTAGMAASSIGAASILGVSDNGHGLSGARAQQAADPSANLYPFEANDAFKLDRSLTDEALATAYNNFYEFGSHKRIAKAAQALKIRPWEIKIDGMVESEQTIAIDDLLKKMPLEERLYRHRCVETWSMAVPWSGFAFSALIDLAKPLSSAKYVRMETFKDASVASGQRQFWYPWPYVEGLTMEEAKNELAFLVTGVYGKPLPKQMGAPLRLAVPWKYGFKSIKSIVRVSFTDKRPVSFWEEIQPREYGFWANVNPEVAHPRWSQAEEEPLGSDDKIPTLLYNGYAEQVASLYENIKGETLFR